MTFARAPHSPSEYFKDPRRRAASIRAMAAELREDGKRKLSLAARLDAIAAAIDVDADAVTKAESARLPKPTTANPRPKSESGRLPLQGGEADAID